MSYPLYVFLATTGREDSLLRTLRSLNQCAKPDNFQGLVVVENGAREDVEKMVSAPEFVNLKIKYLYSPVASKSNAMNIALRACPEEDALIFFTDNDIVLGNEALVSYSSAGKSFGPGHYFGGSVERTPDSAIPERWKVRLLPLSVLGWDPQEVVAPIFFLGCNWAAFKSDINSLQGFDERFGPGSVSGAVGQETDMQTRLLNAGLKSVYVKGAVVAHRVSAESTSIKWMLNRQFRAGVYSGLNTIECDVQYDRSCAENTRLRVIDSAVKLTQMETLKFKILRQLMKWMWSSGVRKGRAARGG